MLPGNENRNDGTFACFPGTKTGTRVQSPKPPFYETALLFPLEGSLTTSDDSQKLPLPSWPKVLKYNSLEHFLWR